MLVTISSTLDAAPAVVRQLVQRSDTLIYISHPLIRFVPIQPSALPDVWSPGDYLVSIRSLGVLPLGTQVIRIEHPPTADPDTFLLRDNGSGQLVRVWDHLITIRPDANDGKTQYADRVEVSAGVLTPFIWLFAQGFYRWRQYRWKKLLSSDGTQLP
jgi:hypothetical protein